MNLNKVMLIGRLGKDPEVKTLSSGQSLATFSLAVSENWVDRDGKKQEKTEWMNCKVFGKQAETVGQYLLKGQIAFVEGKIQTRSWETDAGEKKYITEVLAQRVQFGPSLAPKKPKPTGSVGPEPSFDSNEELPF